MENGRSNSIVHLLDNELSYFNAAALKWFKWIEWELWEWFSAFEFLGFQVHQSLTQKKDWTYLGKNCRRA